MTNTEQDMIRQLGDAVARSMGGGWSVDTEWPHHGVQITGPNEARVFLTMPTWPHSAKGKVNAAGMYPGAYDQRPGIDIHNIMVSRDRGPETIAKEITRRLLPKYLPDLERAQTRIIGHTLAAGLRNAVGEEFAAALGTTWTPDGDRLRFHDHNETGYGEVQVYHSGDKVSLDLRSVPTEIAREIVAILARR